MSTSLVPAADTANLLAQIEAAPGIGRLRELLGDSAGAGPEMTAAIVEEAARFSHEVLSPFNAEGDRHGCRLENGRVRTAPGHEAAWRAYLDAGWLGIDQPSDYGGQDLPIFILTACQELFDRSGVAFGMLPTAVRAAARLLAAHADEAIKAAWLPKLVSGEWGATICISEPEAGSDAGRIRTLATSSPGGDWSITGEKIWISYGDHDLSERIGHCLLARTPDAAPGGAGLSLFLVPSVLDGGERNHIAVRRLEGKLGLHASPTCALGFEGARGRLIGAPGRGLAQLFTMITTMRLMVSVQGLAVAGAASDTALSYAEERRQGGRPDAPPLPIVRHADVQRLLLESCSRVEALRGLILAVAVHADLARLEPDSQVREEAQALVGWLLPIAKTLGGEAAFEGASDAIQVLGGAGYVKDWPVEQLLRDSRVLTIFEGTSGIQAQDLLHRRLRRDEARGLNVFLALANAEIAAEPGSEGSLALSRTLDLLNEAALRLVGGQGDGAAYAFLRLAGCAALGWISLRLSRLEGRLAAAGAYGLTDLEARARLEHARIALGDERMKHFEAVRRPG